MGLVRPNPPSRPRWGVLYAAVAAVVVAGWVAEALGQSLVSRRLVDFAMVGALIAAMGLWVRANRQALARSGEPETVHRPLIRRVIRSRPPQPTILPDRGRDVGHQSRRVVRLHPEDEGVLPYDFD